MANISRTAKSGSDWTVEELRAYNITVEFQDAATFFGVDPLPQPAVAGELLNRLTAKEMVDEQNFKLLQYMGLATKPVPESESESAVNENGLIPFTICGQECYAPTDVHILGSDDIILLLVQKDNQKDKRHPRPSNSEAQLIAKAIAAFQANNSQRRLDRLLANLLQDSCDHATCTER